MAATPDKKPAFLSLPGFSHKLRKVAAEVREIGYGKAGWHPEAAMLQKDEIAAKIERLAAVLDGGHG